MSKVKCGDCGKVFDECEIITWREDRGEFWGMPFYETLSGCPFCHGLDCENVEEQKGESENDKN